VDDADPTDADLLRRWAAGDTVAGRTLFERHAAVIARFFANKVDSGASDLVQETFLVALEGATTYRSEASWRSWLLGIAYNKLRHHYQHAAKVAVRYEHELPSVEDLGASPSEVAVERQEHRLLLRALRRIPLQLQVVLELRYWEGMKAREIAAVLELPEGTINSRLHRARVLLEQAFADLATERGIQTTTNAIDAWAAEIRRLVLSG
jgi:RNA polymerase sigma-70 factor (ECF subfamily)